MSTVDTGDLETQVERLAARLEQLELASTSHGSLLNPPNVFQGNPKSGTIFTPTSSLQKHYPGLVKALRKCPCLTSATRCPCSTPGRPQ